MIRNHGDTVHKVWDSARRTLFLAAAFLVGILILGLLALGGHQLYRWHPWAPDAHDSRADDGSDPRFPLGKSLRLTGTSLPTGAVDVHYSAGGNMMGTSLSLTYRLSCDEIPTVLAEEKQAAPTAVDDIQITNVRNYAEKHGWRPDDGSTAAYFSPGKRFASILVQTPETGNCSVYVHAFD